MDTKVMKSVVLTVLLIALTVSAFSLKSAYAQPPATEWTRTYGGTSLDWASAMVQTADGGYALVGLTESFGAGNRDGWLVKTDASGNMQWNKTYGGTNDDSPAALVQTGDGGYALAGGTQSFGVSSWDAWLVKTDASGNMEWNKTYGGNGGTNSEVFRGIVQTGDGGYALAGQTGSSGAGGDDFWLVKTDAAGNAQWNKTYGGTNDEAAYAFVKTGDGGYALAGFTYSFGAGGADFWLVKTDSAGNAQWDKTYGGTNDEGAGALVKTADGGYALVGSTKSFGAGDWDFWLVKTDSAGNAQWDKTYGGTNTDGPGALVQTADGGYALAGQTLSYGAGGGDTWLVKTDSVGNMLWNKAYGGTNDDGATVLVQTADGGYALAGPTNSFGAGNWDFWLVKLAPEAPRVVLVNVADGSGDFSFSSAQKSVGDAFVVNITITGAVDLGCWQVGIQWDPSLLSFAAMSVPSDNVFAGRNPIFAGPDTSVPGLVVYGGSVGPGMNGFSGNGTLAQLTLQIARGVGVGEQVECDIAFESILVDTFLLNSTLSDVTLDYAFNNAHYTYIGQQSKTALGDLNQDGVVDILDAVQATSAFGSYPGHPRWNGQADLNNDNVIDIFDIIILAGNFGKTTV